MGPKAITGLPVALESPPSHWVAWVSVPDPLLWFGETFSASDTSGLCGAGFETPELRLKIVGEHKSLFPLLRSAIYCHRQYYGYRGCHRHHHAFRYNLTANIMGIVVDT